jgi:hypothetical protein
MNNRSMRTFDAQRLIQARVAARAEYGAKYSVGRDLLIPGPTDVQIPAELAGD